MNRIFLHLIAAIISAAAGFFVFVYITNRYRHRFRMGGLGTVVFVFSMMFFSSIGVGVIGFFFPKLFACAGGVVIFISAAREVMRRWLRARCRGTGPVETHNVGVILSKPLTTSDAAILRYELPAPALSCERLRVALVSDLHVGRSFGLDYYEGVFNEVNRYAPDLMFLPGDFVANTDSVSMLPPVLELCRARLGVFAVRGNHDFWSDAQGVADALENAGIRLLRNETVVVKNADARVAVSGCENPWAKSRWQPPEPDAGELLLVLAHTADMIYRLSASGAHAVFCGHYHAGQARLPGWGPVFVPSRFGRRFDHGHFIVNQTHLFVTAGVGASGPVVRIYCQPDVFLVDFLGRKTGSAAG